jgi:transcriptional regulator with XRE-family HTH domain
MHLCDRLQAFRLARRQSAEFTGQCTGLSPFEILRIEHGLALPSLDKLERWAEALQIPLSSLFFDADATPSLPNLPGRLSAEEIVYRAPR